MNRGRMLAMAIAARRVGRTDASERVADACIALAQRSAA
jgi:UDP-N-acetylglucosamine:LPS N-acetylglucosamine transferase